MSPQRLPTVVVSSLVAVLCIVVLLSAAARLYDLATAPAGSGLSAVDGSHLAALQALFDWEVTAAGYHDARTHIIAISERFRSHRVASLAHVTGGVVVLLLGGLQFAHGLRRRVPMLHRWSGRTLLVAAAITGVSGLYFGVGVPYAGVAEALPTLLFGTLFLLFVVRAYRAARCGEYARHREWMIRMFSLAAGVGTIRLVGLGLVSAGVGLRELIGWSFAIGWVTSLVAAEWWIRHTRVTPDIDSPIGMPARKAVLPNIGMQATAGADREGQSERPVSARRA
jgi:uncharacterized membrane protein